MPQFDLFDYYTEAMQVPFYEVPGGESLGSISDKLDMKPSFYLGPLTEVWAEKKPLVQRYVGAKIGGGPHKDKWGLIYSGHLRQARHKDETVLGQKLTGASYGVTKNVLEANDVVGTPSAWRNAVTAAATGAHQAEPVCQRCQSPMRSHKVYESVEAREFLKTMAAASQWGGQTMLGVLFVFDTNQALVCVIGAESGWDGRKYQDVFGPTVKKLYGKSDSIWANEYLGLNENKPPSECIGQCKDAVVRDWRGESTPMKGTGEAMQCAGPKLIQAYLKWDAVRQRNQRATDTLFMSEIWGPAKDAKPTKAGEGFAQYGGRQSASSCMRCRTEIPPMLCGKPPALAKADLPHLLYRASHD